MTTDSTHEARIVPGEASAETIEAIGYQRLFDAIAAATSIYADGVGINISVKAFKDALLATPSAPPAGLEAESRELLAAEVASCGSDYDLAVAERIRDGSLSTIISPACALRAIQRALSARQIAPGVDDAERDREIVEREVTAHKTGYRAAVETMLDGSDLVRRLQAMKPLIPSIYGPLVDQVSVALSAPPSVEADAIVREMRAEGQMVGGTNSRAKIRQRITAWADRITRLSGGEVERLREALEPFAKIKPSTLHPEDGSEAEEYIVTLKGDYGNPAEFTGADLARARTAIQGESRD